MEVERGLENARIDLFHRHAGIAALLEVRDLGACPQLGNASRLSRGRNRQRHRPRLAVELAGESKIAGHVFCTHDHGDRLAGVKVGQRRGIGAGGSGGEFHFQIRHHRVFERGEKFRGLLGDLGDIVHEGERAPALTGGVRHEVGVGRRADANREQAGAAKAVMDGGEELVLVADRAVRDEHDLADFLGVPAVIVDQGGLQSGEHFRAAVGLEVRNEAAGAGEVLFVRGYGSLEDQLHRVVEADDVELIRRGKAVERQQQALLGLRHRLAGHGAGVVDHEDGLAVAALSRGFDRGRVHDGEQVVLAIAGFAEQAGSRRGGGLGFPRQDEVAVSRDFAVLEMDARAVSA